MSEHSDTTSRRRQNNHFGPEELEYIRKCYDCRATPCLVAKLLGCSTRVINKYYAQFRAVPWIRYTVQPPPLPRAIAEKVGRLELRRIRTINPPTQKVSVSRKPLVNESRFYRSDFEPA